MSAATRRGRDQASATGEAAVLRCAGCGTEGRQPAIDAPPNDPRPILRITFNWRHDGRAAMVCPRCTLEAAGERLVGGPRA